MIALRSLTGVAAARCAVVFKDVVFTGQTLNRQAERLADALSRRGVGPGHRVGVLHGNTPSFAVSVCAAMKVGASAALLSTRTTSREVAEAIDRAGVSVVMSSGATRALLAGVSPDLVPDAIALNDGVESIELWPTRHPARVVAPSDEATVQFTSGVSGRAKMVARTTANLQDELEHFAADLNLTEEDATVCPCPLSHTYGFVNGFLLPFFSGRPTILSDWFLPNETVEMVRRAQARVLIGIPTMYKALLEAYGPVPADLASLRLCFSAGMPLAAELADDMERRYGLRLNQQYGTTETGVMAINTHDTAHDVTAAGRPVSGRDLAIVDEDGAPVSDGDAGEVVVRSGAAATGYVDDPQLSAERFRDGRYFTGDIGTRHEGLLRLQGRRSAFINVAGLKVDPHEVERVLATCDAVAECVVVPRKDRSCGEVVRAVVVPRSPATTAEALQRFCRGRLASHKVPREVTFVDALPRSPSGKVLVKDLIDSL